jgi:hypothetical protein
MFGWAGAGARGTGARAPAVKSVLGVELVGHGLIELEIRHGLGLGGVERVRQIRGEFVREQLDLGWPSGCEAPLLPGTTVSRWAESRLGCD